MASKSNINQLKKLIEKDLAYLGFQDEPDSPKIKIGKKRKTTF